MGVQDAQIHIGRETTYGTPVTPTRSIEGLGDGHKRQMAYLESDGMRPGKHTMRSDRRRAINMGAEGEIEINPMDKGFGMLLRAAFGSSTIAQQTTTSAWLQTHLSTGDGPVGESLTVQLGRPMGAQFTTTQPFTYHGGKVTEWELTQELEELLKFKVTLDFEDEDKTTALLGTPVYPANTIPFGWHECSVTVDGAATPITEFELSGKNGLKTDRRQLGTVLKREPLRSEGAEYEGKIAGDFESIAAYDRFVAGTIVPVVATWTGGVIEGVHNFELKATLAAVQFTGDTPEVSMGDLPTQPMPYRVLHNGTDPAVKLEYKSSDVAF